MSKATVCQCSPCVCSGTSKIGSFGITNILGPIYYVFWPAYRSVKALITEGKDDDTELLSYWVLYAIVSVLERYLKPITWFIPFYSEIKCLFFGYIVQFGCAHTIFEKLVLPYFPYVRDFIDDKEKRKVMIEKLKDLINKAGEVAEKNLPEDKKHFATLVKNATKSANEAVEKNLAVEETEEQNILSEEKEVINE